MTKRPLDAAARAEAPGQFVRLSRGWTHYELSGPENGPRVVLVHGFSTPAFIWDPLYGELARAGFRVLRYDLFGRGWSDRPEVRYNRDLYDQQLEELLDALGFTEPVTLAGLSMGGAIVAVFAQRHRQRVSRLILLDPAGLPMPEGWQGRVVRTPVLGDWLMKLLGDWILVSGLKNDFYGDIDLSEYTTRYKEQMQFPGLKRALISTVRSDMLVGARDAFDAVGRSGLPVLLIWGEQDETTPFALSQQMRELIPQAEFHAIPEAGHLPHMERPERVIPLVIGFLKSTALAAERDR